MDELVASQTLGLREERTRLTKSLESRGLCVVVAEDVGLACAVWLLCVARVCEGVRRE